MIGIVDADGTICMVNGAVTRVFGYYLGNLVGCLVREIVLFFDFFWLFELLSTVVFLGWGNLDLVVLYVDGIEVLVDALVINLCDDLVVYGFLVFG